MKPAYIYIILSVWIALTVPWFFTENRQEAIFGFPPWAFYSFAMTVGFAVLIATVIQLWWPVLGGDENGEDE